MKNQQGKYVVGHITIKIKGSKPELFFQYCAMNEILVWDVEKIESDVCKGTIYLQALKQVKMLLEGTHYELSTAISPRGLQPAIKRLWHRKEILVTGFLCMLLLFGLSNIAWKLDITNVPEETERDILKQLNKEGLYKGAWTFNLNDLDKIQQNVLQEIPYLMYIGIRKNGTTYHIDAIEKQQDKKEDSLSQRDLIASKGGEIQSIFIKNGMSKVAVHDVVKKGDLLVSGIIENELEEEGDDEKERRPKKRVPAEGKILANTWYEMDLTSTLQYSNENITGKKYNRFNVTFSEFSFPIWGFKQPYSDYIKEENQHRLKLFNHYLPISIDTETYYEVQKKAMLRNKLEAKERALQRMEATMQRKYGKDVKVLYYKVLHERVENGKVKINLYVSLLEDIAKERVIQ